MSGPKARYNVTIRGEIDNLTRYTQTLAAIIAHLPNGEKFKQIFDVEYFKHRAKYLNDGAICEEIEAVERVTAEAGLTK